MSNQYSKFNVVNMVNMSTMVMSNEVNMMVNMSNQPCRKLFTNIYNEFTLYKYSFI